MKQLTQSNNSFRGQRYLKKSEIVNTDLSISLFFPLIAKKRSAVCFLGRAEKAINVLFLLKLIKSLENFVDWEMKMK